MATVYWTRGTEHYVLTTGLIRERILEAADDLHEPGTDPYYGKGRINVAQALGLIQ